MNSNATIILSPSARVTTDVVKVALEPKVADPWNKKTSN